MTLPAGLLEKRKISTIEKVIVADIGYFNGNGYRGYTISNGDMAKKFGVSRRTIVNAIQRLRAFELIKDVGIDGYHRCLKLNGEVSSLFGQGKGEGIALPDKARKFQKPTAQEVTEYAESIGYDALDGQYFVDSYEAKNWMIGKNKMRNWKAAVRTWKARQKNGDSSKSREYSDPAYAGIR